MFNYNLNLISPYSIKTHRFTTKVVRASPSTSSAMMTNGFRWAFASSRAGIMDCTLEIFFSLSSNKQSLNSTFAPKCKAVIFYHVNSLHIPLTPTVISLFFPSSVNYFTSNESYKDPFIVSPGYKLYSHYVYHHYITLCDESVRSPFRFYIFACINYI